MNNKKLTQGVIVLLAIIFLGFLFYSNNKNSNSIENNQFVSENKDTLDDELGKRNENILPVTITILDALGDYYLASTTYPDDKNNDIVSSIMFSFLEQNRYLSDGNMILASCSNDSSQVVSIVCGGMTLGAKKIISANDIMINFLRSADANDPKISQEISYRFAENLSAQKEGYKLIFISAPQIGSLYFKGAESDNPTGPIPYLVTKEERQTIIKEIDERFGDYIKEDEIQRQKTGNSNAVLGAVKQLKSYVVDDTYEEARGKN